MTDPLTAVEERNRYRRALEIAQRDLRIIAGGLRHARDRSGRGDLRSLYGQADAALYRVDQALRWEDE